LSDAGALALRVNGRSVTLEAHHVDELLDRLGFPLERRGLAVAVNGEVVPRTRWAARILAPGDEIEIVGAVQGG